MTTPERVAELLADDERLTPEQRQALADLFRVAYEQIMDEPTKSRRGRYRINRAQQIDGSGVEILNLLGIDPMSGDYIPVPNTLSRDYLLMHPEFDEIEDHEVIPPRYECMIDGGYDDIPRRIAGKMRRQPDGPVADSPSLT